MGNMKKQISIFVCVLLLCVASQIYADEIAATESLLRNRAYDFMNQGWGGEAIQGYATTRDVKGFFHRVGKVTKESVRLIKRIDNPSVNDEFYSFQYDGMIASVYLAHFEHEDKVMLVDVVITSPDWPVKKGLGIGTARQKIETLFGKSMVVGHDREWTYGDGSGDVTYTFDKNDKCISIHWHDDLD
jgi:hypothetical protein